jgi:uncharacterized membrane protein YhaH (DUF805 family)
MNRQLGRGQFWIAIAVLLAIKFGIAFALAAGTKLALLGYADTTTVVVLALVMGGRFKDAGWYRWLGIVLTLLIMMILPAVILFSTHPPLGEFPPTLAISTAALLILIVVAGSRPSAALAPQEPQPPRAQP